MRPSSSTSLLRRAGIAAGAAVLGLAVVAPTAASAAVPAAQPTGKSINTFTSWDGSQSVAEFGCPNTTTYGEVITATTKVLKQFTFAWQNFQGSSGSMVVRGEVFAWDGAEATGSSLFESKPRAISFNDSAFHMEKFKTGHVKLQKGSQYVIFASIDKDYEQCTNNYELAWGTVDDTVYPGGTFVFENNGGDESLWTQPDWVTTWGADLAFKACL